MKLRPNTIIIATFVIVLALSRSGTIAQDIHSSGRIAFSSQRSGNGDIYSAKPDGSNLINHTQHASDDIDPSWSPDGSKLVFSSDRDGNSEIYILSIATSQIQRLTDNPANDTAPSWSPDGTKIAFTSDRDGVDKVYIVSIDSPSPQLITPQGPSFEPAWSPDGQHIAYAIGHFIPRVAIMDINSREETQILVPSTGDFTCGHPAWSQDGTKLSFWCDVDFVAEFPAGKITYNTSDGPGLYVANADGTNPQIVIRGSIVGPHAWAPDGNHIVFTSFGILVDNQPIYGTLITDLAGQELISFLDEVFVYPSWSIAAQLPTVVRGESWGHIKRFYTVDLDE